MSQLIQHFGFSHHPFSKHTPANAIYHHQGFKEAEKRMLFATELYSIAMLLAESGCGKSLLLSQFSDQLKTQGWSIHYMAHSTLSAFSLINVLARKLGLSPRRSRGETAMAIIDSFMHKDRKYLLIIDEAHDLPDATMEDIRLLTIGNFDQKSPFMLILSGQRRLDDRLQEPIHTSLDQRISTVARLMPLSLTETQQYIAKRLEAAGANGNPIFEESALSALHETSSGIPRRINTIGASALIVAASNGRRLVSAQDVYDAQFDRGRPQI
jgi:MSHA biogenesis protein MshM